MNCMSQILSQLRDHLTVIIGECDMLEDTFVDQSDITTRIDIIRNAAHRIANAIDGRFQPASGMFTEDRAADVQTT